MSKVKYDGKGNTTDYLKAFKLHMSLYNITNKVMCRVFNMTQEASVLTWLQGLPWQSIVSNTSYAMCNKVKSLQPSIIDLAKVKDVSDLYTKEVVISTFTLEFQCSKKSILWLVNKE